MLWAGGCHESHGSPATTEFTQSIRGHSGLASGQPQRSGDLPSSRRSAHGPAQQRPRAAHKIAFATLCPRIPGWALSPPGGPVPLSAGAAAAARSGRAGRRRRPPAAAPAARRGPARQAAPAASAPRTAAPPPAGTPGPPPSCSARPGPFRPKRRSPPPVPPPFSVVGGDGWRMDAKAGARPGSGLRSEGLRGVPRAGPAPRGAGQLLAGLLVVLLPSAPAQPLGAAARRPAREHGVPGPPRGHCGRTAAGVRRCARSRGWRGVLAAGPAQTAAGGELPGPDVPGVLARWSKAFIRSSPLPQARKAQGTVCGWGSVTGRPPAFLLWWTQTALGRLAGPPLMAYMQPEPW